jgi:hypothetical protein
MWFLSGLNGETPFLALIIKTRNKSDKGYIITKIENKVLFKTHLESKINSSPKR